MKLAGVGLSGVGLSGVKFELFGAGSDWRFLRLTFGPKWRGIGIGLAPVGVY